MLNMTSDERQRLRDVVNADVKDDGARILLHRAINAYDDITRLRAALTEALDEWQAWNTEAANGNGTGLEQRAQLRINELRNL